jgi:hypothetical protein
MIFIAKVRGNRCSGMFWQRFPRTVMSGGWGGGRKRSRIAGGHVSRIWR